MGRMDFETIAEYLDDRFTPAELVEEMGIPMDVLISNLLEWMEDNRTEKLNDILDDSGEQFELFPV